MLPIHMGIDRIVEMVNHRTVKAIDIRSLHIVQNSDKNKCDYVLMFKKLETHRLLLDICSVNQSELITYFMAGNEEIQVSVPNVLKPMKKEVISKMRDADEPFWNIRIFHQAKWTIRTTAKMVEDAINHFSFATTSTNEIAYLSCNPHCAYVGFHNHKTRQLVIQYLRDIKKIWDFRIVAEQARIVEFEPIELIRAKNHSLIEESKSTSVQHTQQTQNSSQATTTGGQTQKTVKRILIKQKEKANQREVKNVKKFLKYLQKVRKDNKFDLNIIATGEKDDPQTKEYEELSEKDGEEKSEKSFEDDGVINIDTDEDFSD